MFRFGRYGTFTLRKHALVIYRFFFSCKNCKFQILNNIFLIVAENIDCRYTLKPPHLGGSNEYAQSMFWSKNEKIGIPLHTPVLLYKYGIQGVFISRTCFPDDLHLAWYIFFFFLQIFPHKSLASLLSDISKQYSPICEAAECGVPAGAILFA